MLHQSHVAVSANTILVLRSQEHRTDTLVQLPIISEGGRWRASKALSMLWQAMGTFLTLKSVRRPSTVILTHRTKLNFSLAAAGGRAYPRQVGKGGAPPRDASVVAALDAIPECATSLAGGWKWFEFPITDPVFTGGDSGSQGPDRVIAISQNAGQGGTRSYIYCLSVTHRGTAVDGAFDPCVNG